MSALKTPYKWVQESWGILPNWLGLPTIGLSASLPLDEAQTVKLFPNWYQIMKTTQYFSLPNIALLNISLKSASYIEVPIV